MGSGSRVERIGLGLLLAVVLVIGLIAVGQGAFGPATALLAVVPAIGWFLGNTSAYGRALVLLALVLLLDLGVVGSASIHPGISVVLVIAGSLAVGYLSPTRWAPAFALILPTIGALVFAWFVYPAAQEDSMVAIGMIVLVPVIVAGGLVSATCSVIGASIRRQRSQPPHRIADLLGP